MFEKDKKKKNHKNDKVFTFANTITPINNTIVTSNIGTPFILGRVCKSEI